jgi:hypothetical protein
VKPTAQQRARAIVAAAADRLKKFPSLQAALREDSRGVFERDVLTRLDALTVQATAKSIPDEEVDAYVRDDLCLDVLQADINRMTR